MDNKIQIKIKNIKRGLIWDTVVFEANSYIFTKFDTFLGTKKFWLNEKERVILKQKKWKWFENDKIEDLSRLITSNNQTKFNWEWSCPDL